MIKTLKFCGKDFQAEKITKQDNNIIGQDNNGNETFAFRGISDFSQFTLEEGQTFDTEQPTPEETLSKEVANLKISDMKKDAVITSALQTIASLKVEVMNLKGGTV